MYEYHRYSNGINPYVFIGCNKILWGIGCATHRFTAYKGYYFMGNKFAGRTNVKQ